MLVRKPIDVSIGCMPEAILNEKVVNMALIHVATYVYFEFLVFTCQQDSVSYTQKRSYYATLEPRAQ